MLWRTILTRRSVICIYCRSDVSRVNNFLSVQSNTIGTVMRALVLILETPFEYKTIEFDKAYNGHPCYVKKKKKKKKKNTLMKDLSKLVTANPRK